MHDRASRQLTHVASINITRESQHNSIISLNRLPLATCLGTLQDRSLLIKPEKINNFLRLFRIVLLKWQITKKKELEDLFSLAS